jgi:ABC-type glycerol-3-phosphate transport system permease component
MQKKTVQAIIRNSIVYFILFLGSVAMLIPFVWMLSTSLKESYQVFAVSWIPHPFKWSNYLTTFTGLPFGRWLQNTVFITVLNVTGTVISSMVVAYGFARFRAPGRNLLFILMLSTMMLPETVTMIPVFYLFKEIGWMNSFYPLIVPVFFCFKNAFFIFLLRQFFMTIPMDLEEAAKIDGGTTLGILWRVILPLTVPAMITVALFQFNTAWNDFMGPLLYLNKPDLYTLALGINFFKSQNNVQWNYLMVASVVTMLPSLFFYFIGQKYFVESITLTGMKG